MFFSSCNSQEKNIKMKIVNKSNTTYDSLKVYFYSTKDTVIKNFKPNDIVERNIKLENYTDPSGEKLVTFLLAFKDDYYYYCENGIIGFPYSNLENEYNYFVYDDFVTTKDNFAPTWKPEKKKISDIKDK